LYDYHTEIHLFVQTTEGVKMRKKISLIKENCSRCGKELLTTDRSLYALDIQKYEFDVVCMSCTTSKESMAYFGIMGRAIQQKGDCDFDLPKSRDDQKPK